MTTFLLDSFTDTNNTLLENHEPDIGGAWEPLDFALGTATPGVECEIINNTLRTPGSTNAQGRHHRNETDPGADEYDIYVTMRFRNTGIQQNRIHAVSWRMSPTGTANEDVDRYTLYGRSDNSTNQGWEILKTVGGVQTSVAQVTEELFGTTKQVRIEVRNGSASLYVDDEWTLTTADTSITQRGRVGICTSRAVGTDHWMDDLQAVAVTGLEPVGRSIDLSWAARAVIVKEVDLGWATRESIGRLVEADWSIRSTVGRSVTAGWNVGSGLGRSVGLAWSVQRLAGATVEADWEVRALAGRDADVEWTVSPTVGRSADLGWDVLAVGGRSAELHWETEGVVHPPTLWLKPVMTVIPSADINTVIPSLDVTTVIPAVSVTTVIPDIDVVTNLEE